MIQGLRRRLTLTFGLLTSLVLVVMLMITCHLARSQYKLSQEVLYQTRFQSLTWQVQQASNISNSWLAQLAQDQDSFFYVEVNGIPLHYSSVSLYEPGQQDLLALLKDRAEDAGFSSNSTEAVTFDVQVNHTTYRSTVYAISDYLMFYCQDLRSQYRHLREITLQYALLGAAGVVTLLAISTFLSHLATRPTETALREQQDFIAAASHELRSPLTVIRACLYTAQQGLPYSELEGNLALADREAERMGRLVNDLLTLAGSGTGRWSLQPQPVELETISIQLYEQFLPAAQETGHPFQLLLPEDPLPVIQSDPHRLIQLLSVLLSNALDHTPTGTEVALAVKATGRWVLFSVIDHGAGIPDLEKEAVFRRFYRADKSRTDKQHFGLGLSIAKELSALLGGRLTVQDTPGGGATFALRLGTRP